jgi:hypothetical protein
MEEGRDTKQSAAHTLPMIFFFFSFYSVPRKLPQFGSSMSPKGPCIKGLGPQLSAIRSVGSNKPLVLKTDTHETEKISTRQFLLIRGCKHVLTPAKPNTQAQNGQLWLLLISLMQLYLHLTQDLSSS